MSHFEYIVVGSTLWRRVVHSHKRYTSDPHIRASKHEGFIHHHGSRSDYRYCTSYYDQLKESNECEVWRSCSGSRNVRTLQSVRIWGFLLPLRDVPTFDSLYPPVKYNNRSPIDPLRDTVVVIRRLAIPCCWGFLVQAIVLNSFSIYRIATSHFKDCFTTSINGNGERTCFGALKQRCDAIRTPLAVEGGVMIDAVHSHWIFDT